MFEIRKIELDKDIQELAKLASVIWNEYFINIISQKQIDYMVEMFQSYPALSKAIQEDHYMYFGGYVDGELVSYCGVKPEENRLFLSKLYIRKDMRGYGYSSILLKEAIAYAKEKNLNAVYLTCNKYNTHSLDVYKRKGFYEIDSVVTDIGNDCVMDDYILQLDLDK